MAAEYPEEGFAEALEEVVTCFGRGEWASANARLIYVHALLELLKQGYSLHYATEFLRDLYEAATGAQ